MKHVIHIAAENGALPGGKVGGVADVVRDLPVALASQGWAATVITPSYGVLAKLPGAKKVGAIDVAFRSKTHAVQVFEVPGSSSRVRNIVFEHPLFSPIRPGQIYSSVEGEGPYATDASKFAFFGAAAATWVHQSAASTDVVHLHDWHAASFCLLRNFSAEHQELQDVRTVFTIHNLSYQGIRPLRDDESSLDEWFPGLDYDVAVVRDPDNPDCFNPVALAIRTADGISTVSPTYSKEILRRSDPSHGFVGGEGLEKQLANAAKTNKLVGILNGCDYSQSTERRPSWRSVLATTQNQIQEWRQQNPADAGHKLVQQRFASLPKERPAHVLVSVGRLVSQKSSLFLQKLADGRSALEHIVDSLDSTGVMILLGSGEVELERQVEEIAKCCNRLLFLRGYSESLADAFYRAGDLFLMPSSFEPCGISQMLAMRARQPCVVHGVGGLRDTVEDGRTGFVFGGDTPSQQAANFVETVSRALALKADDSNGWQNICIRAASERFDWSRSARQTIDRLYEAGH